MALLDDFVVVLDLAAGNHGLVTRPQLMAEGISSTSIARLADTHRALTPLGAGLYVVPALEDLRFGHMRAALQRVDPERYLENIAADPLGLNSGVLSHHAAAELHGAVDLPDEIHVTVPRRRRLTGLTTHTLRLDSKDVVIIDGMPATSVERTTYDLGRWPMDGEHRSRWVNHCVNAGLLSVDSARHLLGPSADDTLMYLSATAA
ncbi:type IV toxin-antitoxin system AbiEi family antitoxin domain-containing protein [Devriesea agamarum]|uniref:type IV toxin-antitoxin system AbiEi family antitoxin domain-containing protein n=1 Tax=Devriesea agamarum TaxID=472569 RepID=UPI00071CC41E|nr:type IV toxin-antitoxin system AbiEi family antitoxin domain-containing protein [Devriesea agamarum]